MKTSLQIVLLMLIGFVVSACNLTTAPEGQAEITQESTLLSPATRTPSGTLSVPTAMPLTLRAPTTIPGQVQTTRIVQLPATAVLPPAQATANSNVPVSIVILSPIPGNVVAGNVQVLGSAIHPQFLQYQLEYGPDPNPGNLWYAITGGIQTPVLNNLLGIWNTSAAPDGTYQLRLRVFLRDSSNLTTVINSIRIQNQIPTPRPSATPNIPRPIAAFTASPTSGQTPLRVRFSNQSAGNITAYQWNFGDGTTSGDPNPRHDFNTPGLYTVTLTVTGPSGTSNVSSQINVLNQTAPNAGFNADRFTGTAPLTVQFTDTSAGNVTSYHWDFSDGTGSTDPSPSHIFRTPGIYNVFLTVIGPGGSSSARREITVQGPTQTPIPTLTSTLVPPPTNTSTPVPPATATSMTLPIASFDHQLTGDLTVQFRDISTSTSGRITEWRWDFGDGSGAAEQNPVHVYPDPGTFTVTLTVSDLAGSNSTTAQVDVPAPIAPIDANFSAAPAGDLTIQFADSSTTGSPGGVRGWTWDFGDGSSSNEQNPIHTYPAGGTYPVTLTISDGEGRTDSTSNNVDVAAPSVPPDASFGAVPSGDLTIQFLDTSTSANSTIAAWAWDFGDGQSSADQNPTHTFPAGGSYTITLRVTDANGLSDDINNQVNVAAPAAPPSASFTTENAGDLNVRFIDTSTAPSGSIVAWAWDFGDGQSSADQNPVHDYPAGGTYTVGLTITDSNGQMNSTTSSIDVTAPQQPQNQGESGLQVTTPVLPDLNSDAIRGNLRGIYERGAGNGNRAAVFSIAGDGSAMGGEYLDPFRDSSTYILDGETGYLQGIIDWFNSTDLNGATSFNRNSLATGADWRINALLNPDRADSSSCNAGESPLACELRVARPAVVIISIGYEDISNSTSPDDFRARLQNVIDTAASMGVIPVLTTVQPRSDNPDGTRAINDIIIEVASANNVPVYNLWARFSSLPNNGFNGDNVSHSQAPSGPGDITSGAAGQYGANARNRDILTILDSIRSTIFPDAPAP